MKHYNGENVSDVDCVMVDGSETCLSVTETSHFGVFPCTTIYKVSMEWCENGQKPQYATVLWKETPCC